LSQGQFKSLLVTKIAKAKQRVARLILCSGKIYYELIAAAQEHTNSAVVVCRIEQLYPFPADELTAELAKYSKVKSVLWLQEEPKNQGAWLYAKAKIEACLSAKQTLEYVGRAATAAPATGYAKAHRQEQQQVIERALGFDTVSEEK